MASFTRPLPSWLFVFGVELVADVVVCAGATEEPPVVFTCSWSIEIADGGPLDPLLVGLC